MRLKLAYDLDGLIVDLPDSTAVIEPQFRKGLGNIKEKILECLRQPISSKPLIQLVDRNKSVVIVHTDITRATPNKLILPILLAELDRAKIPKDKITFLNGLGTHRQQTRAELIDLLGRDIATQYRCLQHNPKDRNNLKAVKTERGMRAWIHRAYLEADIRILTGFIEPHFFAGFSGGPKSVLPAIADLNSIQRNHSPEMLSHPKATWGITNGNPLWEEMLEVALATKPTFLVNVALNSKHKITGVFCGDLRTAHQQGCEFVKSTAMAAVHQPYDIVLTTNSGYPLDQNLYQSVKGICAASQIVRTGGAIIIATACRDGLPENGNYANLLAEANSLENLQEKILNSRTTFPDQWQVQKQVSVQQRADVFVYSDGLSDEMTRKAWFIPCRDIGKTIHQLMTKFGSQARICAIPQGPQTIPYLDA